MTELIITSIKKLRNPNLYPHNQVIKTITGLLICAKKLKGYRDDIMYEVRKYKKAKTKTVPIFL
jgi:hypothetical protein